MSNTAVLSPDNSITKTRNAILRIKNCSPKLRTVLRQRCLERIQSERLKIVNRFRKITIQDRVPFLQDTRLENYESSKACKSFITNSSPPNFNLDEELLLEELLDKELLSECEEWLLQQYDDILNEELKNLNEVVCPLCRLGYLESNKISSSTKVSCDKCLESFVSSKSLLDLQSDIYECLAWHDSQCNVTPGFVNIPKNENESNLCIICSHCSYMNIVA